MPKWYHMLHLYAKDVTLTGVFKVLGLGDAGRGVRFLLPCGNEDACS